MKKFLLFTIAFSFTFSSPAIAAIVYSGSQNIVVTPGDSITIHVAGSTEDWDNFTVEMWETMAMASGTNGSAVMGIPGTRLVINGDDVMAMPIVGDLFPNVANLPFGTPIGPCSSWSINELLTEGAGGIRTSGNFDEDGGYIGLRMFTGGDTYYGWLHLASQTEIGIVEFSHTAIFDGWAYEDEPGVAIGAGVVPAPGALLMVGFGTGLVTWLRRRRIV